MSDVRETKVPTLLGRVDQVFLKKGHSPPVYKTSPFPSPTSLLHTSPKSFNMPVFNVTLKADAPPEELQKAKETAQEKGGVIQHEYSLIKGFTVAFPDDHVDTLESTEHIHVEQDGAVNAN